MLFAFVTVTSANPSPPPPQSPPPPLTPGGAWLAEMDLVLTFRNVTAEAFNGNGTGDFDYRANLTEIFITFFVLQPSATWSEPIDGQREATVTLGNVTTLESTGIPEIELEASVRVVASAGAEEAVVANFNKVNNIVYPHEMLRPGVTLESIGPPTIALRQLVARGPKA